MSLTMTVFTCAVLLAGKMSIRNGLAGVVAGIITGFLSSIIIIRVGGVVNWAIAGVIIWLIIALADKQKEKNENEENKGKEGAINGTGN